MRVFRRDDVKRVRIVYDERRHRLTSSTSHTSISIFFWTPTSRCSRSSCTRTTCRSTSRRTRCSASAARIRRSGMRRPGRQLPALGRMARCEARVLAVLGLRRSRRNTSALRRTATARRASRDHWEYLLLPLALEYPAQTAALRYRQLEYYRMPFMAYLAVDDPTAAHARGLRAVRARHPAGRSRHAAVLRRRARGLRARVLRRPLLGPHRRALLRRHALHRVGTDLRGRGPPRRLRSSPARRPACSASSATSTSCCSSSRTSTRRRCSRSSDELAVAMNRLTVGDTESVKTSSARSAR